MGAQPIGSAHGSRFYPHISGVARSHNFYPTGPMRAEDGIVAVALGFGETVMSGHPCIRFCPSYPLHPVQFSSVREVLENSQRRFFALPLHDPAADLDTTPGGDLELFDLAHAESDGTLAAVGSTYSRDNDVVYDSISRAGVRLVTFAPILKHRRVPLAEILDLLLRISADGTSAPVEIEFALTLDASGHAVQDFGFLQLRPLALSREAVDLQFGDVEPGALVCQSSSVLGNGRIDVQDLVVVDFHRFDRGRSQDVARDVARFNADLVRRGVPYALIGVGRWGSAEPFLGIRHPSLNASSPPGVWGEAIPNVESEGNRQDGDRVRGAAGEDAGQHAVVARVREDGHALQGTPLEQTEPPPRGGVTAAG